MDQKEIKLYESVARGRHGNFSAKAALVAVNAAGQVEVSFVSQRRINKKQDPQDEPFKPPSGAWLSPEDAFALLRLLAAATREAYVLHEGDHCRVEYIEAASNIKRPKVMRSPEAIRIAGAEVVDDPFGQMLEALAGGLLEYERLAAEAGFDASVMASLQRRAVQHVLALFGQDESLIEPPMPEPAPPVRVTALGGLRETAVGTRVRITKIADDESQELVGLTGELVHPWTVFMQPGLEGQYVAGVWLDYGLGMTQERRVNLMLGDEVEVVLEPAPEQQQEETTNA